MDARNARTAPRRVGRQVGGVAVEQLAHRSGGGSVRMIAGQPAREPRKLEVFVGGVAGGQPRCRCDQQGVHALEQRPRSSRRRGGCWTEVERLDACQQPFELAAGDHRDLLGVQSRRHRGAQDHHCGGDGPPVGRVRGEQDLAGREQREQGQLIGGVPPSGIEEQVALPGRLAPDP